MSMSGCSPISWGSRWRSSRPGRSGDLSPAAGSFRWLAAAGLTSLAFLVHLTTAMVVLPAMLAGYAGWVLKTRGAGRRAHRLQGPLAASPERADLRSGFAAIPASG